MYTWRKVRSIPTWYKGTRFRSKLEASWAEFFTVHRMQWAYEPEGFDFDGVLYLPDFWLPEIKTFVEVKGILQEKDEEKLWALATAAACQGIMTILAESPVGKRFFVIEPTPQDVHWLYEKNGWNASTLSLDIVRKEYPKFDPNHVIKLGLCRQCNQWAFVHMFTFHKCPICGHTNDEVEDWWGPYRFLHTNHYCRELRHSYCPDCGADSFSEGSVHMKIAW